MSTSQRKRVPAAERRRLLLDAAGHVFADRGYQAAGVDAIARSGGVTVPVFYDHFDSKGALYAELVRVHYAELRAIWFTHASTGQPVHAWLGPAVNDWFAYVERHPFAGRMLFNEATGDAGAADAHREIQNESRREVTELLRFQAALSGIDLGDDIAVALVWETLRAVLQGLAVWWQEHRSVPRTRIVEAAMNAIWVGLNGVLDGKRWTTAD
jgi:TetR/AcrR family transcriptional regulator